jgi:Mrp family chromosome partitioning ATPase
MSALEQAIIKAYAKDRPATAPLAADMAEAPPMAPPARRTSARTVEQAYHDGALYRVELPTLPARAATRVPVPHLPTLPPTSPRRSVRRSMLRLLSANAIPAPQEKTAEQPQRVARKVIIRHISHGAAPPPLGLLEPSDSRHRAELPPEKISNEPVPRQVPPLSLPAAPAVAPHVAPLNVALSGSPAIDICGDWSHHAAVAPLVVISSAPKAPATIVSVQLDALTALAQAAEALQDDAELPAEPAPPSVEFRVDPPHAHGRNRPHAKFVAPPQETSRPELNAAELTFADASQHSLAGDTIPLAEAVNAEIVGEEKPNPPAARTRPAVPLWEVDRFQWPRVCEKLVADERSYLSRAGDKLLAAVQDGLKVLAVTGTRRGEGRTTLTLCLARAAAKAGIQTAVMDADFARPNLATKVALEVAYGWQDAALGRIPLSEAAVKSLADNITLLPLESSSATRTLSLADPRVTATIRAAAATFELLLLDLGPLAASEQLAFPVGEACPLDAAIVVRDLRFATVAESDAVGQALLDAGVEAVGVAENFAVDDEIPATSV